MQSVDKTHSKKSTPTSIKYQIRINDIPPQNNVTDAMGMLRQILNDITDEILKGISDMVHIVTSSELYLDVPISMPFCLRGILM